MPSLATKERKAKFNTGDLIFRKESNLPSGTLLSAEYSRINNKLFGIKSKQTVNLSNMPKKPFPLTP